MILDQLPNLRVPVVWSGSSIRHKIGPMPMAVPVSRGTSLDTHSYENQSLQIYLSRQDSQQISDTKSCHMKTKATTGLIAAQKDKLHPRMPTILLRLINYQVNHNPYSEKEIVQGKRKPKAIITFTGHRPFYTSKLLAS